mgnify:CR=1 FL=1
MAYLVLFGSLYLITLQGILLCYQNTFIVFNYIIIIIIIISYTFMSSHMARAAQKRHFEWKYELVIKAKWKSARKGEQNIQF